MQQRILHKRNLPDNQSLLFGNGLIKFTNETLVEHLKP
jgi:hypothetical protein